MTEPMNLDDLIKSVPAGGKAAPGIHVPKHGDCLFAYLEDAPYHAVYVDPILTVFEALDDDRLVGFQLKGLSELHAENFKGFGVSQRPDVVALLFASYKLHPDGIEEAGTRAKVYSKAATAAAKALDLQPA